MKLTLLLILFIFSCNTSQNYKVTGVIKEIHNDKRKLLIDHEEIPGFMVKMVMFFNLHKSEEANKIQYSILDNIRPF